MGHEPFFAQAARALLEVLGRTEAEEALDAWIRGDVYRLTPFQREQLAMKMEYWLTK